MQKNYLNLKKKKSKLLEQSNNELYENYFCFISKNTSLLLSHKDESGLYPVINNFYFEIISADKKSLKQFFSIEFEASLQQNKKNKKLQYHYSSDTTTKSSNTEGFFLINNYSILDDKQKEKLISKMEQYYNNLEENADYMNVEGLKLDNIIGYLKMPKANNSLKDFISKISQEGPTIVDNHIDHIIIKEQNTSNTNKEQKTYDLTPKEKEKFLLGIKNNFYDTVTDTLNQEINQKNYLQVWEQDKNKALRHFKV